MTSKERLALARPKEYLLNEIKNYTTALNDRHDKFNNYYEQRIEQLELEIAELEGVKLNDTEGKTSSS